jgi:hypothetical protein
MGSLQPNNAVAVAVAAAVVLAALATGGSCWTDDRLKAVPPGPNITADYDGKWLAAKATWYGSPVGAGPDDDNNGTYVREIPNLTTQHPIARRPKRPYACKCHACMTSICPSDETSCTRAF